jgi:hypothetical protein
MHFTPEQVDKAVFDIHSRFTAYDCLFTTVFASLLASHSEAERAQIRQTILDGLRFGLTGVPSAMPDAVSMQIQADAIACVEGVLNGAENTIRKQARTSEQSSE